MKSLTFDVLQALTTTRVLEFPGRDVQVTVRELMPSEFKRVQQVAIDMGESPEAETACEVLTCSIGITDADYDSDKGRAKIAAMPVRMRRKIAEAIFELSAIDLGGIPKNLQGAGGSPSGSVSPSESFTPTISLPRSRNGSGANGKPITRRNRGAKSART